MATGSVMDWFLAAMIHDIGKTLITQDGWWKDHGNLKRAQSNGISFSGLLTLEMIERIRAHEWKPPQTDPKANALIMADRLQKAMYESLAEDREIVAEEEETLEDRIIQIFDKSHLNPPFFPYYGQQITWTPERSAALASEIAGEMQQWNKEPTLRNVLALEKKLVHSPHSSPYLPHNSLAFHQRFTSLFFYFIYRQLAQLKSVDQWQQLELAVVTIKPDPLNLFYRLKDVRAHETTIRDRLRNGVFERVFKPYTSDLPQMTIEDNPFEFFGRDAIVLVVENSVALLDSLQRVLDEDETESLRHLTVSVIHFTIKKHDTWTSSSQTKWEKAAPNLVTYRVGEHHLLSSRAARFEASITPRCERCNQPLSPLEAKQGSWCAPCAQLIAETENVGERLDALGEEGERRGFVFLNLAPLHEEAVSRAKDFFAALKNDTQRFGNTKPGSTAEQQAEVMACLKPTPTGIFEYLQAVMEIQQFQNDLLDKTRNIYPLVQFPELMIWVTTESVYWDFIAHVSARLTGLHLDAMLSGVLCHPRTPFWSLMDRLTTFEKQEGVYARGMFYDLSGGEVMIFSDEEVTAIRDLGSRADRNMERFKSQLNALVQMARVASLRELEMEIDERDNLHKINSDFCAGLKSALNRMTGDDQKSRDKRALFIKNVVRLAGFGSERRR